MNRKLQVFVSSTYEDMKEERQAAVEAILMAGHIPAGMELFAAGDKSQMEVIRRWIDESDVFMLILGGRYGSIERSSNKSYIHLEYEYAVERNKRLFATVMTPEAIDAKVRANGAKVVEQSRPDALKSFKEVVTGNMCSFFSDPKDLQLCVFRSLSDLAHDSALPGWVRGSEVMTPKEAIEELTRAQAEITRLTRRVAELEAKERVELFAGLPFGDLCQRLKGQPACPDNITAALSESLLTHHHIAGAENMSCLEAFFAFRKYYAIGISSALSHVLGGYLNPNASPLLAQYGLISAEVMGSTRLFKLTSDGSRFLSLLENSAAHYFPEVAEPVTPKDRLQ